jgi:asparagine synthase (glutamine-hydrolysing)
MCGICGSTRAGDGSSIRAMNAAMEHRGPDDEGVHLDRSAGVGLGARRLSVIDVAGGHQPLSNEDGSVWAVLNGEIYNHPALRQLLLQRGHALATSTDTEVLVHLYEEYGDDLVHALEGMFAFAVWDARRQRMLVARDRFGEKPLFYSDCGDDLVFASELSALTAGGATAGELDPGVLDQYFVDGYVAHPTAIVAGARQLPPAHVLTWERGKPVAVQRYWSLPAMPMHSDVPVDDYVGEMGRLLEESVRSRMIADVTWGVLLSGGTDSTLIAALASRLSPRPVKTFTVGYDMGRVNETAAARRVASALGTEHHEVTLTADDLAARAVRVLGALDQPLADQALMATHAVAEFARREVTVAVGGEGADELFGGYPRYRWLARGERLREAVPAPVLAAAASGLRALPLPGRLARLADLVTVQPPLARHVGWVTGGRPSMRAQLYGPRLRNQLDGCAGNGSATSLGDGEITGSGVAGAFMRLDQARWLPDDILAKADRASMQVSLELRTPYLQRELAELAASMPAAVHQSGGGKYVLRRLLGSALPGFAGRRKVAFRVPAAAWLRGPLLPVLTAQLRGGSLYEHGWFDRGAVSSLVAEHWSGRRDRSGVLWSLLALGLWADRFYGRDER